MLHDGGARSTGCTRVARFGRARGDSPSGLSKLKPRECNLQTTSKRVCMMTSGDKALTNEIAQVYKTPSFQRTPSSVRRELAIDREKDSCNKPLSLVQLGGFVEAMVISREFNVTGTSNLFFFAARPHAKVLQLPLWLAFSPATPSVLECGLLQFQES